MLTLNFSPFPVLETERLLLRKPELTDSPQVFKMRSDETAMKFLDKPIQKDESEAVALIQLLLDNLDKNNGITWAISLKEDPSLLIGTIGLWRMIPEHYRSEIGYMLLSEYFNKGYITEAIHKVNEYAFTQTEIHSIEANINPENIGSETVLQKTGYIKEAHFRENYYFNGVFKDTVIYSKIK